MPESHARAEAALKGLRRAALGRLSSQIMDKAVVLSGGAFQVRVELSWVRFGIEMTGDEFVMLELSLR